MAEKVLSNLFENNKLTKKSVVVDNDQYRVTSLDVDMKDMKDVDGNQLDLLDKIKEMCGDDKMIVMAVPRKKTRTLRECFGTPKSCANCVSKDQDTRFPDELKRCSACHVLSYCTENCQREHWLRSHSKICKALCGKKNHGKALHKKETCPNCDTKGHTKCHSYNDKNSLEMACMVEFAQRSLLKQLWMRFGYHGEVRGSFEGQTPCRCTSDSKKEEWDECTYLMDPPFILGELSGKYLGWIDKFLSYLGLLACQFGKKNLGEIQQYNLEEDVKQIRSFAFQMRGEYWYYATLEKSREMTDYIFGEFCAKIGLEFAELGCMANVEKVFGTQDKKHPIRNIWWETLIFHFSEFFRKIKDTRFFIFNLQKVPAYELTMLKSSYKDAMWNLSQPSSVMFPIKRKDGVIEESFLVQLPEGTKCIICYQNLEGKKAQWYLQNKVASKPECVLWKTEPNAAVEDLLALRYGFDLPIIFFFNSEGYKVCCSGTYKKHLCLEKMLQLKSEWYQLLYKQSFTFGIKSEKCKGCLKYSLQSHRCSDCKSVRYCSNGCLQDDWKFHEVDCSPDMKKMEDKKLKKNKKCTKENANKKMFAVVKWLAKNDHYSCNTMKDWEHKISDKDALLCYLLDGMKDLEEPKKKSKYNGKTEEMSNIPTTIKSVNKINESSHENGLRKEKVVSIEYVKKMEKFIIVAKQRIIGKRFELRHMKSKTGQELNGRTGTVMHLDSKLKWNPMSNNARKFELFDSRVNCKMVDNGKVYAIKLANLVEPEAGIKDGNVCHFGHKFRMNDTSLVAKLLINKHLADVVEWAEEKKLTRPDQLFRVMELKKMMAVEVDGYTTDISWDSTISCMDMDLPKDMDMIPWEEMEEDDLLSTSISIVRPGCVGDMTVNFTKFHQMLCGCENQLVKRFREFIKTGMCQQCQAYYIEKKFLEEKTESLIGQAFVAATR